MNVSAQTEPTGNAPLLVGRYAIYDSIASGGMATVHLGRLVGPAGFSRTVAIKRLHPQFAKDPEFTEMFLDEARMAARVQHPNVVPTLDVLQSDQELLLVMEYVRGDSLARLIKAATVESTRIPPRIIASVLSGALQGLHAAHEATSEKGLPLGMVHRDMSPQNIIVGIDGTARVLDFGVAKAEGRMQSTQEGQVKGKLLYMPPEQMSGAHVTRTADIYAMGLVLFEALTGTRMFAGDSDGAAIARILRNDLRMPSQYLRELAVFDPIIRRASALDPLHRYPTAREMAFDVERCVGLASPAEVGAWVERLARRVLDDRARRVSDIESSTSHANIPMALAPLSITDRSGVQASPLTSNAALPVARSPISMGIFAVMVLLLLLATFAIAYLLGSKRPNAVAVQESAGASLTVRDTPAAPLPTKQAGTAIDANATAPTRLPMPPTTIAAAETSANAQPTTIMAESESSAGSAKPRAGAIVPASPQRINCSPPYTVDKNGHRHFIPECN